MRQAIREHLADLEGTYVAERRLIESRAWMSESVPLQQLMSRYGLEN